MRIVVVPLWTQRVTVAMKVLMWGGVFICAILLLALRFVVKLEAIIALVKQLIMYFFSVTWGDAAFTI